MAKMEVGFGETKKKQKEPKETKTLLLPFCKRELLILVGEILKWAVMKQGV